MNIEEQDGAIEEVLHVLQQFEGILQKINTFIILFVYSEFYPIAISSRSFFLVNY